MRELYLKHDMTDYHTVITHYLLLRLLSHQLHEEKGLNKQNSSTLTYIYINANIIIYVHAYKFTSTH